MKGNGKEKEIPEIAVNIIVLGSLPLGELRPAHLKSLYLSLGKARAEGEKGLSPNSISLVHRVLHKALEDAVKAELVVHNAASAVSAPRPGRHEARILSPCEVPLFLETARRSRYYIILLLALHTGMRRSELLGLRWKDIDLDMASLSVSQVVLGLAGGKLHFSEPKTAKGRRQIALTPTSVLTLRGHKEKAEADRKMLGLPLTDDDLVFARPDGSPERPTRVTEAFRWLARKMGLRGMRFHDLRHTHASLMLAQGIHPKVVQERLGHATIGITLDTYSHVVPGLQEAAARRFEGLVSNPLAKPSEGQEGLYLLGAGLESTERATTPH
ncbi:MAG: site-specific integrase [Chloroflexi bacterium]|nr:site-specific integrase [Chloroflexota bacterium]